MGPKLHWTRKLGHVRQETQMTCGLLIVVTWMRTCNFRSCSGLQMLTNSYKNWGDYLVPRDNAFLRVHMRFEILHDTKDCIQKRLRKMGNWGVVGERVGPWATETSWHVGMPCTSRSEGEFWLALLCNALEQHSLFTLYTQLDVEIVVKWGCCIIAQPEASDKIALPLP